MNHGVDSFICYKQKCKVVWVVSFNLGHVCMFANPCAGSSLFATFTGSLGYFILPPPPRHISSSRAHIATKFQRLSQCFRGQTFNGATSGIAWRRHNARNSRWRSPKWNVHILRLYGWWKTISNTQWGNLNVHELNENKNGNIWNMSTPASHGGVVVAPKTGSIVITSNRNKISIDFQRQHTFFVVAESNGRMLNNATFERHGQSRLAKPRWRLKTEVVITSARDFKGYIPMFF